MVPGSIYTKQLIVYPPSPRLPPSTFESLRSAHFARSFKEAFGVPPHRYPLTRRIERATAMLRDTDLSITEIAFETGRRSLGAFGRTFRDVTGESPGERRAREKAAPREPERVPVCFLAAAYRPDLTIAVSDKRRQDSDDKIEPAVHTAVCRQVAQREESMKKSIASQSQSAAELISNRIAELGDWRGDTLSRIRSLIKQAAPGVTEEWKWRGVPTWYHDGMICAGETYKDKVKVTFAKGAELKDPSKLFNSSLDGNVRRE